VQFLNPIALIALGAALIPLAIHLLQRGQTHPLPFSNLQFLRTLHHSRMRRMRLRQWLLLLLRTLALALIALAFSRPSYQTQGGWWGTPPSIAAVVLLDRSFSTAYRAAAGRHFDQLRLQAERLLDHFNPRDEINVFTFDAEPVLLGDGKDPEALRARLQELTPSAGPTNIENALQAATERLAGRTARRQEVYLLTDLGRHDWPSVKSQADWLPDAQIYVTDLESAERPNVSVNEIYLDHWLAAVGTQAKLVARLSNHNQRPVTGLETNLYLDGERVGHQQFDLAPMETRQVEFTVAPRRTGRLGGYVEVDDDGLSLDNRRYFTFYIPQTLRVLLLGKEPAATYYPRRALGAGTLADPLLEVSSALLDELDETRLRQIDILVLCNLERLNSDQTAALHHFVAAGGGLAIFPGPQSDLSFYNRHLLPGLIPAALQSATGQPATQDQFRRLDPERPTHPLFQHLLTQINADRPRFFAAFELIGRPQLNPLIQFDDGRPALIESTKDQGRVLLFATPLSLAWSDLPHKGLFVPLMHRLIRHLGQPPGHADTYLIGQSPQRYLGPLTDNTGVQAESPTGKRFFIEPQLNSGRYFWKIPSVAEPGLWRLLLEGEETDLFAVNVDTQESMLTPVPKARLQQLFGATRTHFFKPGKDLGIELASERHGRELWRECLLLALVLLVLELWIGRAPRQSGAISTQEVDSSGTAQSSSRSRSASKV
jgi:hypothetical protein